MRVIIGVILLLLVILIVSSINVPKKFSGCLNEYNQKLTNNVSLVDKNDKQLAKQKLCEQAKAALLDYEQCMHKIAINNYFPNFLVNLVKKKTFDPFVMTHNQGCNEFSQAVIN